MKNMKRAERRHKKRVKFIKRLKNWVKQGSRWYEGKYFERRLTIQQVREQVISGECLTFLRTTGRPCNCWMCTFKKYERTPKHKILKQVWKEIND